MTSEGNPPLFFTPKGSLPSSSSFSDSTSSSSVPNVPLSHADARVDTRVDFVGNLSELTLDGRRYYIPTASTDPLFDSFTIDAGEDTVVISIFQITISSWHGGSAKGYKHIRKIITRVRKLLKDMRSKAVVKIECCLVCPGDKPQYQWQMPRGWCPSVRAGAPTVDAFCTPIPDTSCLPTPGSTTRPDRGQGPASVKG